MAIGRIDIQYRRVDCTPPLPVSIAIDNNVGVGGWLRLVVEVRPASVLSSFSFLLRGCICQASLPTLLISLLQLPSTQRNGFLNVPLDTQKTAGFGGITAVSIRGGGGSWSPMNNKFGSAWEVSNTPGLPWDFQFTSDGAQTVRYTFPTLHSNPLCFKFEVLRLPGGGGFVQKSSERHV
jgi:hypothetical protein